MITNYRKKETSAIMTSSYRLSWRSECWVTDSDLPSNLPPNVDPFEYEFQQVRDPYTYLTLHLHQQHPCHPFHPWLPSRFTYSFLPQVTISPSHDTCLAHSLLISYLVTDYPVYCLYLNGTITLTQHFLH